MPLTLSGSALGLGKVLQVGSVTKTDTFSTNSTSFTDVTGLSINITPSSTASKIFVLMDVKVGTDNTVAAFLRLMRDSTAIYVGDAAGSRQRASWTTGDDPVSNSVLYQACAFHLDSPATTSAITYKVQMLSEPSGNTGTVYVNRQGEYLDNNQFATTASSLTVVEIAP